MAQSTRQLTTLLVLLAVSAALLLHPADTQVLRGVQRRNLLAQAKADAISTGGTAVSVSDAQGSSDVTTTSSSTNGGTAVAVKSADDDAPHIVSSAADGTSSSTLSSSTPHAKGDAWNSAPACRNSITATYDDSMRLWGWENVAPCAFKEETGPPASATTDTSDAWDSAPPCKSANTTVVRDDSNRLWGWENGASCAFKAPSDGGDAAWEAAKPCSMTPVASNIKAADNRGRNWGWENGASCAFKGVPARKMLSFVHQLKAQHLQGVQRRSLLAQAKAVAISTGGTAVSVSDSQGSSDVTTSSTTNGGTAIAVKSADDDASHIVSSAADGISSSTVSSSTPHAKGDAWDSAPACRNSSTATYDDSMRLWGWENGAPCAFKEKIAAPASAATGISDAWDTAPPCKSANTSAVLDGSNRLWGWENGASCAFKAPGDGGDAVWEAAKPCSMAATADNIRAADNRDRKWGWENGAACAFKSVPSRKMLSSVHQLKAQHLQGVQRRHLLAQAKAEATSTGGTAVSVSDSQGSSDVTTTSSTTNGVTAVAIKSADDDASHIVSSAADGISSSTVSSSTPHAKGDAWDSAPACRNSSTATYDDSMRLWGWENGAPCAFKEEIAAPASAATGTSDAWDSAPPCKSANTSAVLDGSNRLWGWENGASCAFKAPGDGGDAVWEAAKPCSMVATADSIKAADNRNRKWGWENGVACAFKGTASRKLLSNVDALNLLFGQNMVSTPNHGVPAEDYAVGEPAVTSVADVAPAAETDEGSRVGELTSTASYVIPSSPSINIAAPDTSAPLAVLDPAGTASPSVIAQVPIKGYTIGSVKGAVGTFDKPVPAGVPSTDGATFTAHAGAIGDLAAPANPENTVIPPLASAASLTTMPMPLAAPTTSLAPTWETAAVCVGQPTKQTSVQDLNGRLWWAVTAGSAWASCAYRAADGTAVYYEGYQKVQFGSAAACEHTPSTTNAMADSSGRLWGWQVGQAGEGVNCRFLKADGTPVRKAEVFII